MYAAFESAGVDITKPLVVMCLGGMVSPLVSFTLSLIGVTTPVYDVSYITNHCYSIPYNNIIM